MDIATFNAPAAKGGPKAIIIRDGTEVAARYFVYKLYEATGGHPLQWAALCGMGESAATISRAVERGWVVLQGVEGKPLDRKAALTDEGRRLAHRGNWPDRPAGGKLRVGYLVAASRKMLSRSAGYWRDPVTALRLPPVLLEQIDSRATERDISRSDAMRHLIEL